MFQVLSEQMIRFKNHIIFKLYTATNVLINERVENILFCF